MLIYLSLFHLFFFLHLFMSFSVSLLLPEGTLSQPRPSGFEHTLHLQTFESDFALSLFSM
jgi:hypothetical protein